MEVVSDWTREEEVSRLLVPVQNLFALLAVFAQCGIRTTVDTQMILFYCATMQGNPRKANQISLTFINSGKHKAYILI